MRFRCLLLPLLLVLVLSFAAFGLAEPDVSEETAPKYSLEDLNKMRVKELRGMLAERGVECKACSEKSEIVKKVFESQHLPAKGKSESPQKSTSPPPSPSPSPLDLDADSLREMIRKQQKQQDDLKKTLEAQGMDTTGFSFSNGMDPELLAKIMKNLDKKKPRDVPVKKPPPPPPPSDDDDVEELHAEL
eukprot:m.180497 g.180497  ORF g.180497 m.180497 type:complete len:189 (+) comp21467_c0_seq1:751-1317(+)